MSTSIFNRIYSYRERENKNSQENFFIEILAFCLETDKLFFNRFSELLSLSTTQKSIINTQTVYELGRPDIQIYDDKTNIIIECKIEHIERKNQLEDYAQILLLNEKQEKHLVYLTKYYEHKEISTGDINFRQLKWADIYSIIDDDNDQITIQFKEYINEQNMADSNNFQYQDLSVLKTITSTISKMDEVLDGIKPLFESKIGKFSKDSSRSTRLSEERYVNWHSKAKDNLQIYSVEAGFYWWDGEIYLALRIYIPNRLKHKDAERIRKHFALNLPNWESEDWDEAYNFWHYQKVAKFIVEEDEQIPSMISFLRDGINEFIPYED